MYFEVHLQLSRLKNQHQVIRVVVIKLFNVYLFYQDLRLIFISFIQFTLIYLFVIPVNKLASRYSRWHSVVCGS